LLSGLLSLRLECSRRKVRCDKRIPCSRCTRLGKHCSREVVRTTKSVSAGRDELDFLRGLLHRLPAGEEEDNATVRGELQSRINVLEYGPASPLSEDFSLHTAPNPLPLPGPASLNGVMGQAPGQYRFDAPTTTRLDSSQKQNAISMRRVESLVWSRNSGACYPHRRCDCPKLRKYSELASIIADMDNHTLRWSPTGADPSVLPSVSDARKIIQFHVDHLWWHHNTFHAPTFLAQCEIFWSSGAAVHPLWAALYLSVLCVGSHRSPGSAGT